MITIDALTLRTDDRTLVDGVTMHLAEGALHLLAGPAGAGKTALLGAFDLPLDTPVEGWSPARRRQLALVAALLRSPAVVLLDEPVEGFDAAARRTARRLLLAERPRGTTLIVATRRPLTLADMADELHVLAGGTLCRQYRGDELVAALCAAQGFGNSGKSS